jgi:hypothetical protein
MADERHFSCSLRSASYSTGDRLAEPIETGIVDFGHFWPEVPETPHIGAHPRVSAAVSADRATRKSPANRLVLVLY